MSIDLQRRKNIREDMKTLVEVYDETREMTPEDTVKRLVERLNEEKAKDIIAIMVVAKGEWDQRISRASYAWAVERVCPHTREELMAAGIFYCDDIHPAHMGQIADVCRKYKMEATT